MYDTIIVGTGPAGYTAALYTARYRLKTLLIGEMPGGMIAEAPDVCNFPSYPNINGMDLAMKMEEHVKEFDVEVVYGRVESIQGKNNDFLVKTDDKEFKAKKVILATGQKRRRLNLPGEKKLTGRGVSYCATCDAAFYNEKTVGIVGGGNASLAAALLLARYADKVYILYRKEKFFRPEPIRILEVEKEDNIETKFEVNVVELIGDQVLEGVKLDNGEKIPLNGIFIEIGSTPNNELAKGLGVKLTEEGYIISEYMGKTNVRGIFAAGDVIDSTLKQAITAAGQGAEAAASLFEDIQRDKVE